MEKAKLYKKKAPKKGREKETRTKVQASKQLKRGGPEGGKGTLVHNTEEPLSTETSTSVLGPFKNFHTTQVLVLGPRLIFAWYEASINLIL